LDDSDILVSLKYWSDHTDKVLSDLSRRILRRDLFAIELQNEPFVPAIVDELTLRAKELIGFESGLEDYYVYTDSISNLVYTSESTVVKILLKNGSCSDISEVSDMFDHRFLSERITRYYLCYPKECR